MAEEPAQPKADDDKSQPQADETSKEETPVEEPKTEETPKAETTEDEPSKPESTETEPTEPKKEEAPVDEQSTETPSEEQPKAQTRRERRQERKERYIDSIRSDIPQPYQQAAPQAGYEPLDYRQAKDDKGFLDIDRAERDRDAAAQAAVAQAREQAGRETYRQRVELERAKVEADPKFAFMKEDSPDFDPERTEALNDRYMAMVGYREVPVVDPNTGQVALDATGQPVTQWQVDRTDVSYEKFLRNEVALWERIGEEYAERAAKNTASQRATQGARPTSGSDRKPDLTDPAVVAGLSPAELKKYQPEIDKIMAGLPPK